MSYLSVSNATNMESVLNSFEKKLYQVQARYMTAQISYLQEKDKFLRTQLKEMRYNASLPSETGV